MRDQINITLGLDQEKLAGGVGDLRVEAVDVAKRGAELGAQRGHAPFFDEIGVAVEVLDRVQHEAQLLQREILRAAAAHVVERRVPTRRHPAAGLSERKIINVGRRIGVITIVAFFVGAHDALDNFVGLAAGKTEAAQGAAREILVHIARKGGAEGFRRRRRARQERAGRKQQEDRHDRLPGEPLRGCARRGRGRMAQAGNKLSNTHEYRPHRGYLLSEQHHNGGVENNRRGEKWAALRSGGEVWRLV